MDPPGLVVTPDQRFVRGFDEKDLEIHVFVAFECGHAVFEIVKEQTAAHIDHKSRLGDLFRTGQRQINKVFDQCRRHIVNAVIALVLKPVRCLGLTRTG